MDCDPLTDLATGENSGEPGKDALGRGMGGG